MTPGSAVLVQAIDDEHQSLRARTAEGGCIVELGQHMRVASRFSEQRGNGPPQQRERLLQHGVGERDAVVLAGEASGDEE